ncbi:hypothetical protein SCLCIDRAFT_336335 [Scleroderma citrinum Foug A]|uniref:Uncharacterized protein n=1 Tax=Scleroderma citrinum Foug A TaxID=1036808 RepID=A0A0C3DFV0_9AGAM|nr:hypothetical protein SCLCIDRAFT_336335 [Scleroderma citrinum Foug A]
MVGFCVIPCWSEPYLSYVPAAEVYLLCNVLAHQLIHILLRDTVLNANRAFEHVHFRTLQTLAWDPQL